MLTKQITEDNKNLLLKTEDYIKYLWQIMEKYEQQEKIKQFYIKPEFIEIQNKFIKTNQYFFEKSN